MFVLIPALVALTVSAVSQPGSISTQTGERAVYATVLDRSGTPVTTLGAADFIVREDGVDREVVQASRARDPLQIAVLVDTSQAMRPHVNDLRTAVRSFFREMQGGNEIALFEFGERPTLITDYTSDPVRLQKGVDRLFARTGSGAYALDAIVDVSRGLRNREGARPVIVVISTEGPEFSQRYHEAVLDELGTSHATLHSFVLDRRRTSLLNDGAREREFTLEKGAARTGGRREHLLTSMALTDRLKDLATELKSQYRVVYSRPGTLIQPDTIRVAVKPSGFTVRAPRLASESGAWSSRR
jgi:Ca-activated chloride channel family protein